MLHARPSALRGPTKPPFLALLLLPKSARWRARNLSNTGTRALHHDEGADAVGGGGALGPRRRASFHSLAIAGSARICSRAARSASVGDKPASRACKRSWISDFIFTQSNSLCFMSLLRIFRHSSSACAEASADRSVIGHYCSWAIAPKASQASACPRAAARANSRRAAWFCPAF